MKASSLLQRSIGTRALLRGAVLIGIGTVIAAVITMLWFDSRAHQIRVAGLESTAKIMADGISHSIRDDVIVRNYADLESRLKQAMSDDRISSILVLNEDGSVLSQVQRNTISDEIAVLFSSPPVNISSISMDFQIEGPIASKWVRLDVGVPIGWLKIEISGTDVDDALIKLRRHVGFSLLFACVILLTALAIVLRRAYKLLQLEEKMMLKKSKALEHVAYHDSLTGLPNRHFLLDRINQAVAYCDRNYNKFAVCFGDLDGFKLINDEHGHDAGDFVLKEVARRLKFYVRANDTVARLGGDEFVMLITNIEVNDEFQMALDRILAEVRKPIILPSGKAVSVTLSVGISIYPDDPSLPSILLEHADQAMYEVKRSRKNSWLIRPNN